MKIFRHICKKTMEYKNAYVIQSQLDLPFLETPYTDLEVIFKILKEKFGLKLNSKQKFIDLGSGNGSVILYSALNYNIYSVGIELNINLINEAKDKVNRLKKDKTIKKKALRKIKFKNEDLFIQNLEKYDFIYIFSLPTMQRSLKHVLITAKEGAIIISYKYKLSNDFTFLKLREKQKLKKNDIKTFIYFYEKV